MSSIEAASSDPFRQKLLAVSQAAFSILDGQYPKAKERAIYEYHPNLKSEKDAMEIQTMDLLDTIEDDADLESLSLLRKRTKGYLLAFYVAFTDQNHVALPKEILFKEQTRELVRRLFNASKIAGKTLDLADQYLLAKSVLEDLPPGEDLMDLFDIIHLLHITLRRMARGFDESIAGKVSVSTLRDSKKVFSPLSMETNDPAGDAYHFWGSVGFTLLSRMRFKQHDVLFNQLYRLGPKVAAWVTQNIVYRFGTNDGNVHTSVDKSGVQIGEILALFSSVRQ